MPEKLFSLLIEQHLCGNNGNSAVFHHFEMYQIPPIANYYFVFKYSAISIAFSRSKGVFPFTTPLSSMTNSEIILK